MTHLERRVLDVLERLFALAPAPLDVVLSQSADHIAAVTRGEKVDAFLLEPTTKTLVAVGTSRTELGELQKRLGLDRLPLANADSMAKVFETGEPYHHGRIDQDPRQPRGVVEELGVRSMMAVAFDVGGTRRGVLSVASRHVQAFSDEDMALAKMIAVWLGNLVHRSELMEAFASQAIAQTRRATAEELVTMLAHDLRNLLNPISVRLMLLLERARESKRYEDTRDCERGLAGLERVSTVMSDLLDVARVEQGLLALRCEHFDLVQLVRTCAATLARPDVEVTVASYNDELPIFGDRARLAQAVDNVLANAIKHSPHGVPVHVELHTTVHAGEAAVRIAVIDQGPGIAPELLPRIFDRYVRAGEAAGLGLGLYLARATLAAHGGTISLSSGASQGTRCELVLPIAQADTLDRAAPAAQLR